MTTAPSAIGLDLGTSGVKAVLLAADGRLLAEATSPLSARQPQPGWSEQHPADWLAAADAAVRSLRRQARSADWQAVGALAITGQMHGVVLLDAQGAVLRPAILWNDGRSQPQCAELERRVPDSRRITGNQAMAGFTAPKLLWVAQHEPAIFERTARVLLPKDWLGWTLTGVAATDASDAAGTLWLDLRTRDWSHAMLAAIGLARSHMPVVHEGPDAVGMLMPQWCSEWGLSGPVQVAAGAGARAAAGHRRRCDQRCLAATAGRRAAQPARRTRVPARRSPPGRAGAAACPLPAGLCAAARPGAV